MYKSIFNILALRNSLVCHNLHILRAHVLSENDFFEQIKANQMALDPGYVPREIIALHSMF